jgi:hypothetical protein
MRILATAVDASRSPPGRSRSSLGGPGRRPDRTVVAPGDVRRDALASPLARRAAAAGSAASPPTAGRLARTEPLRETVAGPAVEGVDVG